MSLPRLAALSSPTAESTPRKRVVRGLGVSLACKLNGCSPLLTGLLKSRVVVSASAAGGLPQAAGAAPFSWKIELLLCQSVQCGAPKPVSLIRGAGWPSLLVGQLTDRNICQALRSNSRCTLGKSWAASNCFLSAISTSPGNRGVSTGA